MWVGGRGGGGGQFGKLRKEGKESVCVRVPAISSLLSSSYRSQAWIYEILGLPEWIWRRNLEYMTHPLAEIKTALRVIAHMLVCVSACQSTAIWY